MTSSRGIMDAARGTVWSLPRALSGLRPEACGLLVALNERVWQLGDPGLLELVRLRVAQLIGNSAAFRVRYANAVFVPESKILALPDYPGSPLFSPAERDILAFTEQFGIDVGGTDATTRARLVEHFGADCVRELVSAIYVVEFTQRLQMMAVRLLDDDAWSPALASPRRVGDVSPAGLLAAYQEAVMRGSTLDPMTTELIRLRCARTHRCRICQTLRLADARAAGVDEAITAQIDFYERSDLPDRAKVALRVTDAFITRPDLLSDTVAEQARTSFEPAELASLCLGITKWSTQKIHVALGTDGADRLETDDDGVALFGFDETGRATGYRRPRVEAAGIDMRPCPGSADRQGAAVYAEYLAADE
jgi:AhpD family alkylhydroperoxidase